MGVQMACAYVGATFVPPLFGLIGQYINMSLLPLFLLIISLVMILMVELLNRAKKSVKYKKPQI
jgi:fucose permease